MPGILLSFLPRTPGHFRLPDYESSRSHTSAGRQHALAGAFVARLVKYDLVRQGGFECKDFDEAGLPVEVGV
jgi:hypothetical protein